MDAPVLAQAPVSLAGDLPEFPEHSWPAGLRPEQVSFLSSYVETGSQRRASKVSKISRGTVWDWAKKEPVFRDALDVAREFLVQNLEAEAYRRATQIERLSDILLIFLLKAARPEVYRDNYNMVHSGEVHMKRIMLESSSDSDPKVIDALKEDQVIPDAS
jgi:hypothetical protein